MKLNPDQALLVFSGGQDSTTALYWAIQKWGPKNIRTLTFDYGQKHRIELQSAREICNFAGLNFDLIYIPDILRSRSPLVDLSNSLETFEYLPKSNQSPQATFVPGRNILFLTIAANIAAHYQIANIVTGVCQEDYGGYFDCRNDFIQSMQTTINQGILGSDFGFNIHTPLMYLNKAEAVKLAVSLGQDCLKALGMSHTCYAGLKPPCGQCHACLLRARGFTEAGIEDPIFNAL